MRVLSFPSLFHIGLLPLQSISPSWSPSASLIIVIRSFLDILGCIILTSSSVVRNPSLSVSKTLGEKIRKAIYQTLFYLNASIIISSLISSSPCLLIILRNSLNSIVSYSLSSLTDLTMDNKLQSEYKLISANLINLTKI